MASDRHASEPAILDGQSPTSVWMVYRRPHRCLDGAIRRWERFSEPDSHDVEEAYSKDNSVDIEIQFGRYTVNVPGRWMQAYYWRENKWPVVRGTWFWRDPLDGSICPFGEADAATIEEAYQDMLAGLEEGPIDCELVDTDVVAGTVQFVREIMAAAVSTRESPLSPAPVQTRMVTKITHALYRQSTPLSRVERLETFREYPIPWLETGEEKLDSKVGHLVLLVHGIGEALYNRQNDPLMGALRFRGNCDLVRENLNTKLAESIETGNRPGRIEVLPVEWSESIHSNFLDRRLESVTLPNLASVRDFANLALTDVFLYTQKEVKEKVMKEAKLRIVKLLKKFNAKHAYHQEVLISFIGHSLGSVVLYDLFSSPVEVDELEEQILVEPSALFFLGSPLAMFLTIRDTPSHTSSSLLKVPLYTNCRLFNVFHPYDAIAYRLEPLIDQRTKDSEPQLVPYRGGHRVHVALRKTVSEFRTAIATWSEWIYSAPVVTGAVKETLPPCTPPASSVVPAQPVELEEVRAVKNLNYNERIDWALQESAAESVSEWVAAVGSHFTYWRHDDVHAFVVNRLANISKVRLRGAEFM